MKQQRVRRLALSYLAVIMTLSLAFSVIIYAITSAQLNRPLPPGEHAQQPPEIIERQFSHRLEQRNSETRGSVIISLVVLNGVMLLVGYWLSLLLARRTLEPIERSIEQQAQFVSDASHELRTPLAALLLVNEIALRKSTLTEKKARQVLGQNVAEIKKLTELSNSLLDLAKSEGVVTDPELVNPATLIEEMVTRFTPAAQAKRVKLVYDNQSPTGDVPLQANAVRQILAIFMDNAIKYAPPKNGEVALQARLKKNTLEFIVKDNGPGIAPGDQKHIFERFYRADAARTRTGVSGHGLGLAIAKSLADRCGYTIRIKSQPPNGAEFTLVVLCSDSRSV
ncbi:MAG: sensor histidine kinase [Candidatus Saccharimonas sp.]|jgi:his kinase A (phosphoacceptor) domain./histidine kinase-, DNA gyrase B-, and HSP90-like ATPase|nr:MAG: sensor histidine kinase [Candidatus Saccharimonas sp.]